MKKILILLLISLSISFVFSDEEQNNNPNTESENKYYKIARSLYQKPFGETLCLPFIWLGNLTDSKENKLESSNNQKLNDLDQRRESNLTNWSQLSLQYFTTDAEDGIDLVTGATQTIENISPEGKFGVYYEHELSGKINSNLSYNLNDDLFYSQKSHERRNSFFKNDLSLGFLYKKNLTYLKVKYNNRYYDPEQTNYMYLPGIVHTSQKQMINSAAVHFKQDFGKFDVNIYSNFRDLKYEYAIPEEEEGKKILSDRDDELEYDSFEGYDNDIYSHGRVNYSIIPELKFFANAYFKDDLNESDLYDQTKFGGGLEYDNNIDLFSAIKARIHYYNNFSDIIDNELDHVMITNLRYSKRFRNGISGFIAYINRSCYDNETSKVYRISNMLRIHAMYSYSLQNLRNSYILMGIKYNPENNGSLVFMEQSQQLLKDIYSTIKVKYSLDLYTSYNLKLEYFLTPLRSIWIKDEFTDHYDIQKQNLIFVGTTFIF